MNTTLYFLQCSLKVAEMSFLPPGLKIVKSNFSHTLDWTEYLVFGGVLVASFGIGVFYGFFGQRNKTNEEFIMAGRSMSVFPVTLSLICR